ncbi:MAG: hypothetical protein GX763_09935, partial [Clostridiaceae bacterium]|nr:hypothetical protein [Clostridiaceae bacterium]
MPEFTEAKIEDKAEQKPFLVWFTLASVLLLLALAFVMRLPSQNIDSEVQRQQGLSRRSSFDLKNTDPLSYLGMGTYLARIEEGSVIFIDALGQVQQTYEMPFREGEISSSGGSLFIKSKLSSNLIMFRPQDESVVIETDSPVENIEASEERFLLLHKANDSLGELEVYAKGQSQPLLTLSFFESGYPLDMAFHEDGRAFDLVLLNVNHAQPGMLVHRYNDQGEKTAEMALPGAELLPAIYLLNDDCTVLFNNETVILADIGQGKILYRESFEKIEDLALTANYMAVLLDEGEQSGLHILRKTGDSFSFEHLDSFSKLDGDLLLVNSGESIFLAQ